MVIVCSLKINLTYKSWVFQLEIFWEWITKHIDIITIRNGQWKALPIWNHQHYNGSQQDSGEMALFLHWLTFLHEILHYFNMRVLWKFKYINNSPFPSVFYLSIRIHQHYIGSQQDSGEMALFLHWLTFLHKIFQYFDLRVLWNLNIYNLHQNIK